MVLMLRNCYITLIFKQDTYLIYYTILVPRRKEKSSFIVLVHNYFSLINLPSGYKMCA